jgi:AcrR family transcriptional regulator
MDADLHIDDAKPSGWRGSRTLWLGAARQALLENGVDGVKIQPLAAQMNLSRTSFYWFFKDRAALLDALLAEWEAQNTGAFTDACTAYAASISEALLNLIVVFQDDTVFDPRLDFAVRGWARQSDSVMARVNAADDCRLTTIRDMFRRFGFGPEDADVRARTVYLTQIGYIAMQVQEPLTTRMQRVAGYVQIFCGTAPTQPELDRFYGRMQSVLARGP